MSTGMTSSLKFFDPGDPDTGFLCNFYRAPFRLNDVLYPTVEHAYQASKFDDAAHAQAILDAETPRAAKKLGQTRDVPLRPDWDERKQALMLHWVAAKFCLADGALELPQRLLATGQRVLVEDSPTDSYWGVGADGAGANHLGRILMAVREVLPPCQQDNHRNHGDAMGLHALVVTAAAQRLNDAQWDPTRPQLAGAASGQLPMSSAIRSRQRFARGLGLILLIGSVYLLWSVGCQTPGSGKVMWGAVLAGVMGAWVAWRPDDVS